MMYLKISFLLFLSVIAKGQSTVLEFTDSDFQTAIQQHSTALVMFYAPWCGHCKKLKPEFEKASSSLESNDPPIILAKVDCTEAGKETCSKFQVNGYPTLKIFENGELSKEYNGPREAGGIVKYMKSQVGPSSKELASLAELEEFLNKPEVIVVGFFKTESDLKVSFLKIAGKLREEVTFSHTSAADAAEKYGVQDGIKLFRPKHLNNKFEESSVTYSGKNDVSEIQEWIKENYHGLVGYRTRENSNDFKAPLVTAYYQIDYVKNPKGTNYWRNRVLKVAKEFDKFKFAISSKDDFQHELNEFGIDFVPSEKPVVLVRDSDQKKYVMKEEFSVDNLSQFLREIEEGEVEPYIKSEPIPEDNSGPVKVAVAKNFDDVVTNNGKDTLIEFYAPWCGHCKKLAPVYEELAEKLKNEDVSIVKVDATANDVPSTYDVRGFPTLYWAPRDSKDKPVRYEGGREVEDFIQYIASRATDELKGYDRKGKEKAVKEEL